MGWSQEHLACSGLWPWPACPGEPAVPLSDPGRWPVWVTRRVGWNQGLWQPVAQFSCFKREALLCVMLRIARSVKEVPSR